MRPDITRNQMCSLMNKSANYMDEWDLNILQFPTILFAIIIYLGKYCFVCSLFGRVNMIQRIYKFIKDVRRD